MLFILTLSDRGLIRRRTHTVLDTLLLIERVNDENDDVGPEDRAELMAKKICKCKQGID